jgi:hypothetical protein
VTAVAAPTTSGLRWLGVASVVETTSLVVLVVNLATVHHPLVTSTMGPVHGFAYLATIAVAFLLPLSTGTRLLTLVPAVGGLLALRRARARTAGAGGTPA